MIDKAKSINPIWDIVLYAYSLLILYCTRPNKDPIIKDNILDIIILEYQKSLSINKNNLNTFYFLFYFILNYIF